MLSQAIDHALHQLQDHAAEWRSMPDAERAQVARACKAQLGTLDLSWSEDNMRCLGLEPSERDTQHTLGLDPFLLVTIVSERLEMIAEALEGKFQIGDPKSKIQLDRHLSALNPNDGSISIYSLGEVGRAAPGCTAELWSDPSLGTEQEREKALFPQSKQQDGAVAVVLGAGNQNFLTAVDVIERAFMHKECVMLKHHPLRPYLVRPLGHVFKPLAEHGVFAHILDADVRGAHAALVAHQAVQHVHMTGSAQTHNRVVASLKAAGRDDVVVTSELGNVTPWIVCPGASRDWTKHEIDHHAGLIAQATKQCASANCIAPKLVVLPSEELWPQREDFLAALRRKLANLPSPPPYYPGAKHRWEAFAREYPEAEAIDAPPTQAVKKALKEPEAVAAQLGQDLTQLPYLLVDVGEIGRGNAYALQNEAFAPVLAFGTVKGCQHPEEFALKAANAVNEHVFGTLSCMMSYMDGPSSELDAVVRELNYGNIGINCWSGYGYGNPLSVWGGAPGSYAVNKPCSGLGFCGNVAKIPHAAKGVMLSSFDNPNMSRERAIPFIILDSLNILASGKKFASARIMGVMLRRGFGILPRRMPQGEGRKGCRVCL